jgi:hypothetical protein
MIIPAAAPEVDESSSSTNDREDGILNAIKK